MVTDILHNRSRLLNIGCGNHFHADWENIDMVSNSPEVRAHDLRKGLPYENEVFDACYSSHVLEHLTPENGRKFVEECFRVTKTGGAIRIVVPDLEQIVLHYIENLNEAYAGNADAESNYDWMMIELYDQVIRRQPGGEMSKFLRDPEISNREFVSSRMGTIMEMFSVNYQESSKDKTYVSRIIGRLKRYSFKSLVRGMRCYIAEIAVLSIAGCNARQSFKEGLFINNGETHLWMYDRFSLSRLLTTVGYSNVTICTASDGRIPQFSSYALDSALDGKIRKADSIYIEATK